MFQGSQNVAKGEHFKLVSVNGGTMNAKTGVDRTAFYEELPSNQLKLGLFLEADRMRSLDLNRDNMENQRNVVLEEYKRRIENAPFGRSEIALESLTYDNFCYKHAILGSVTDISSATLDDAIGFFHRFYAPSNAILTLVGDFDPEVALAKIETYFGSIPQGAATKITDYLEERHYGERRETIYSPHARTTQLDIAYPISAGDTGSHYALELLAAILGQGQNSRFHQRIVTDKQIASGVEVTTDARVGTSQFYISVASNPGCSSEALDLIDEELRAVTEKGVSQEELAAAKTQSLRRLIEQRRSVLSIALNIGDYAAKFNNPNLINEIADKQQAVTLLDVRTAAKEFLVRDQRSIMVTLPSSVETYTSSTCAH
jgi:predicted Zn-dependent peptidase